MSTDLIRYDLQVQDALRGVVRKVLADAARDGLPGEHHFYITFRTHGPGVTLSQRLRDQYPEEMTIILQHQFWNLRVDELGFEVGLHFKNVPEKLFIPFDAISGFYDPSVQFGLKFEAQGEDDEDFDDEDDSVIELGPVANPPRKDAQAPAALKAPAADKAPAAQAFEPKASEKKTRGAGSEPKLAPAAEQPAKREEKAEGGDEAKVVSIDAFRKKT